MLKPGLHPDLPLSVTPSRGSSMHPQIGPYGVPLFQRSPSTHQPHLPPSGPSPLIFPNTNYTESIPPLFPSKHLGIPKDPKSGNVQQPNNIISSTISQTLPVSSGVQPQSKEPTNVDMVELDSDIYTAHWMSGFYEPHPTNSLKASSIFDDYTTICKELKRDGILTKDKFILMIRYLSTV